MWILYEFLYLIGFLLYLPSALWRRRLPHRGWSMRLGRYPDRVAQALSFDPRFDAPSTRPLASLGIAQHSIWVHAVSVGEVLAVQPLVRALRQAMPERPPVLSTITPTGFAVASSQAGGCTPIYFPLDLRGCVERALNAIRPRLLLLVESELWPTVIRQASARGIPVAVVNGRISPRAFRRYALVKPWLRVTLGRMALLLMQSQADADRLLQLGASPSKVRVTGSLKWDASLSTRPTAEAIRETAARIGLGHREEIIVAGSTHRGEEAAVLQAFRAARAEHHAARLILAPRHLERLGEVEGLIRDAGFSSVRLSQVEPGGEWAVGLLDTMGQLPRYYGLATVALIGGSLIPHGGQNPLEAASVGKPVVFGPSMHNFESIVHQLLAHHAARQVANAGELTRLLKALLGDPVEAQAMGRRARELTERFQGATQRTLDALAPILQRQ